jgi:hypothetical protein
MAGLAAAAAARRLPVYIALTYDGRTEFGDTDPLDEQVVAAVNVHQLGNKGFGAALGPRAAEFAMRILRTFGYAIVQGRSDWVAGAADIAFQLALLGGWRQAADEMGGIPRATLESWFARRSEAAKAGRLTLRVGHVDFFAQPRGP